MESEGSATGSVLVLDGDRADATIAAGILREAGHDVQICPSRQEGLELVQRGDFDVVVVDVFAPGFEGLALIEELRRSPGGWAAAPAVIVTSGNHDADTAVRALHAGAADYVTKPFAADRLRGAVERVIERRQLLTETSRLRRDLSLFAAGQRLLETLDERQLASRGITTLTSFTSADAAVALGPSGVLDARGVSPEEAATLESSRLPLHWSLRVPPCELSPALARFSEALILDCGEERYVVLLCGGARQSGRFSDADEQNALFLARHLATGFKNAARYVRAEQEARRDPLTGLYNERAFEESVSHALLRASLEGGRHCLLFLDLDRFKQVNDVHGHLMGSQLLIEMGQVLRRCVRDSDVVARYGGDEFVLLLTDAPLEAGVRCAERIRSTVENKQFLSRDGGPCVRLSVSIGVAAFPDHASDPRTLLDLADRAMYEGKAGGRNAVHVAAPPAALGETSSS